VESSCEFATGDVWREECTFDLAEMQGNNVDVIGTFVSGADSSTEYRTYSIIGNG